MIDEDRIKRISARYEHLAPAVLVASAALVSMSIALDGSAARGINGLAGLGWFLSAVLLLRSTMRKPASRTVLATAVAVGLILVIAVKPSDLVWAAVGFTLGGAVVALSAAGNRVRPSTLLPALWLPIHLLVAISRLIERTVRDLPATVRTDPPPTAALVPLAMVLFAMLGGFIVQAIVNTRSERVAPTAPIS